MALAPGALDTDTKVSSLMRELAVVLQAARDCHFVCHYRGIARSGSNLLIVMQLYEGVWGGCLRFTVCRSRGIWVGILCGSANLNLDGGNRPLRWLTGVIHSEAARGQGAAPHRSEHPQGHMQGLEGEDCTEMKPRVHMEWMAIQ